MQHHEGTTVHHNPLDVLTWPLIGLNVTIWPWLHDLWLLAPTPTTLYMVVSALFMLFQMSDKLGLLERWKRRKLPDNPQEQ